MSAPVPTLPPKLRALLEQRGGGLRERVEAFLETAARPCVYVTSARVAKEECHRMFGHRSAGLDEHYGFEPAQGRGDDIEEYEMLWQITFDGAAGFGWGTNWVYVIIHKDDLASARLDRAVVTGANY